MATAIATPTAGRAKPLTFLFLQSFERGSLVPKPDSPGHYLLTLHQGLGDTVYFSDRPAKIVGTVPTPHFLDALGFTPANPPNAALVGQRDATHRAGRLHLARLRGRLALTAAALPTIG